MISQSKTTQQMKKLENFSSYEKQQSTDINTDRTKMLELSDKHFKLVI